jgi:hypothetical protein
MSAKKGITIGKVRSALYSTSRVLGDVNSVARGTVPARIGTRIIGPVVAQIFSALIRSLFGRR